MALTISNLSAQIEGKQILNNLSVEIATGKTAALMGPNGSGKSTLAHILAGHPSYEVTAGKAFWNGSNLLEMKPEERAGIGVFLSFQYPPSIPGVPVSQFLRLALNAQQKLRGQEQTQLSPFIKKLKTSMHELDIAWEFAERGLGEGFSGGEKKRLEMLQMRVLQPSLIILDEVDSGLDIDAIKIVAKAVNAARSEGATVLVITHYQRLLNYIIPDSVHVIKQGQVLRSGGKELALELEQTGYGDTE